jgi:hypothetical protein
LLKKIIKALLVLLLTGIGISGGFLIWFLYICGAFQKDYTPKELVENFNKKQLEIYDLKKYYNDIVPQNKFVEIEFENDKELARFGITPLGNTDGNYGTSFLEWNLKVNTPRMDSILSTIGWSRATLKTVKEKLDNANCIQIESGEPAKIGFKRTGMGMYSFNVFDKPLTDSLRNLYRDSCTYIIFNNKLILEYGGGAIGPQCFYNK